ncbi:uncharacterized protein HMPREF1541_03975 [Cyphellophora europaea CBS 101466]|uniref:Major facilitator superfamily (MFS) profile domain-containing protein n=1 Tax=Cyphellophora europaea (strain CBS 101466) TaxID=1220924 RepID=W2RZX9_CYPE1|nr:uncharacterized protein HMPREF1541_03975 [Cyphellophora europaea CBS 101466]ETN42036.1 hypothetical protein HMPREF1541_03975 [Cyphellophora europaea CBS 101466]
MATNTHIDKKTDALATVEDAVLDEQKHPAVTKTDYAGAVVQRDDEELKLVRKLDWCIMPMFCLMYFMNYVDRNAVAQARLNDLEEDLNMKGNEFNTTVSILFVGYMLMQIPSNMLITRVKRPSWYMSIWMLVWAAVSGCTALVQNYGGLVACRFILGITEAPFYPAATYTLSCFYTRREVAARIAILYGAQILATGFSGLIAAGIFAGMDGLHGIAGWRWLFIVEGSITAAIALFGFFTLPDGPLTTRWLKPRERELAHARMERDRLADSDDTETSTWHGLVQACKDPRTWIFCLIKMFQLSAASFNSFFPTVIKTFGFNTTITLLLTCPPYLLAGAAGFLCGWSSGRHHERTWHITAGMSFAVLGFIVAPATLNIPVRYIACFVFPIGVYSVNSVIVGWAASTLGQTKEKKAVILAMINVIGNLGSIYGAYLWPKTDSPRYAVGFGTAGGFAALAIAGSWYMRYLLKKENAKIKSSTMSEHTGLYGY